MGAFLSAIQPFVGPVIQGITSLFGAKSSAESISQTNQSNQDNAKAQMDFQERMSDTAHQREVADLEAAGLNPILSANAGASTPSGAMATFKDASAPITAAAESVGSSAQSVMSNEQAKANIANTNANTAKTLAETKPKSELNNAIDLITNSVASSARWLGEKTASITMPWEQNTHSAKG